MTIESRTCGHEAVVVEHGLLHQERAEGCDEQRCLDCGEIIARSQCNCTGALLPVEEV